MTIDVLASIFGWIVLLNIGLLLWWGLMVLFAHDLVYRLHTRWFKISIAEFDRIHYQGLMIYKLSVFLLFVTPYLAIRIVF